MIREIYEKKKSVSTIFDNPANAPHIISMDVQLYSSLPLEITIFTEVVPQADFNQDQFCAKKLFKLAPANADDDDVS